MEKFLDSVEKTQGKPRFVVLYVWDAFLWKVKPANEGAVGALGIR